MNIDTECTQQILKWRGIVQDVVMIPMRRSDELQGIFSRCDYLDGPDQ